MLAGGRSERWVAFWASVPGLMAALALVVVLGRSHERSAGLAAGLLCAAHPLACFVSARVLPDELYGAALFLGLLAWQRSMRSVREPHVLGSAALAGLFLSAASLTRVAALGVVLMLVVTGVLVSAPPVARKRRRRPRRGRRRWIMELANVRTPRPTCVRGVAHRIQLLAREAADRYGFADDFASARARAHELMTRKQEPKRRGRRRFGPARSRRGTPGRSTQDSWEPDLAGREPSAFVRETMRVWACVVLDARRDRVADGGVRSHLASTRGAGPRRPAASALQGRPVRFPQVSSRAWSWFHVAIYAAICPMARYSVQVYPLMCYLAGAAFAGGARERVAYQQPT